MFFLSSTSQEIKYYKNWTSETVFGYILGFIFYGTLSRKNWFAQ